MYECPNCNGNLKFYIPSQMMRCESCGTELDPYTVQKEKDAVEDTFYDATVFSCPQCGGELLSMDNEATSFCSFCGAATILNSRISKEKRPDYILPFMKTKEDCKKAYTSMMRHALFAPKELKDEAQIDSFRGIYMPYWIYDIEQKGLFNLSGRRSYRRGDYIITETYDLSGDLDGEYKGISRDASSSFSDNLSESIAPFHVSSLKRFTPSFLSGFYADTADVDKDVYWDDALRLATDATRSQIRQNKEFRRYDPQVPSDTRTAASKFHTRFTSTTSGMFPVWFLSYRSGDRIAYAAVNGQTGKLAADIPVDYKKYLLGSVILAIPVFIVLNLFFTLRPTFLLGLSMLFALVTLLLYSSELSQILKRDSGSDDKGLMSRQNPSGQGFAQVPPENRLKDWWNRTGKKHSGIAFFIIIFVGMQFFPIFIMSLLRATQLTSSPSSGSTFAPILLIIGLVLCILNIQKLKKLTIQKKRYFYLGAPAALLIGTLTFIINPVSDVYYYAGAAAAIIAVLLAVSDLIYYYNMLATRRLPQFDHKGGDDNA